MSDWMAHEFSSHDCHHGIRRTCPFCLVDDVDVPHIASHQRRVAYFSLPRLRMATTETTSSNISKRASIAPGSSLSGSVNDGWANNAKQIDLNIPGVGVITARLFPNQEGEAVLVERLREHFSYASSTEFRFTDSNDMSVPIDNDSLYSSMTVFAHPSSSPGPHTATEQTIHTDEFTQEQPRSSNTSTMQVVERGAQRVSRWRRSSRRENCSPATQDVVVQSPQPQQLPQPQAQPSSRTPGRSTILHVRPLDETPSEMYQPLGTEEPIGEELVVGGYGPQLQQVSYQQSQLGTPDTFSTDKSYTLYI